MDERMIVFEPHVIRSSMLPNRYVGLLDILVQETKIPDGLGIISFVHRDNYVTEKHQRVNFT